MFVTFEGIDGAGKSTLIRALAPRLEAEGHKVLVTREPGAGTVGAAIRDILLHGDHVVPEAELFLFLADRSQHVRDLILPALEARTIVLCDRHADSTLVYQGYGRGLDLDQLRTWNSFATRGLQPHLTFLLDLSPDESAKRTQKGDRLDQESADFRERVRQGFLSEASLAPARWRVLDATEHPEDLVQQAWGILSASIPPAGP